MELFELYLSPSDDPTRFRAIVIQSSAGEKEAESFLAFIEGGKDWRTTLIKTLESVTFSSKDFQQPGEQDWMIKAGILSEDQRIFHPDLLKNIGQALYKALFPPGGKLEGVLQSALRIAETKNTLLHIQLKFEADSVKRSRLADYPWELLHDGKQFLAHHQVTFSRYIAHDTVPPNLPPIEQINVLLISSAAFDSEQGLKKLSNQEQQAVQQGLQKAQAKGYIKLSQLEYSTIKHLRAYLTEHRGAEVPHVLHFDGHGLFGKRCPNEQCRTMHKGVKVMQCRSCKTELREAQGYLVFENEDGDPDYVSAEELGTLLRTTSFGDGVGEPRSITLAVLSACQSGMSVIGDSVFNGTAQNLIGHRVPAVVAMQYSVTVDSATKFAEQFYRSLGQKNSLAIAVSQGREAMGLASQQWFRPVLYLRWPHNEGGQLFKTLSQAIVRYLTWKHLLAVSFTVTCVLFGLRFFGLLEAMELKAFDHLMQLRPLDEGADPRLLVIEITDNDLNVQVKRNEQGQGTLKDTSLNRLLKKLEQYQPRLVGLDLYRDFETSADETDLVARLSNERFFAVCKVSETDEQERVVAAGIAPPREVVQGERFGFSDFIPDSDRVVRRFLIAQEKVPGAECATKRSFSLALARRYLELEGSQSNKYEYKDPFETQRDLQIGNAIFKQLQPFTGGYQDVDASGYQVLLNYRATGEDPKAIAKHVSLEDVLNDGLSEQDVRDKIVLIGITAKVAISDDWFTPYGTMSGVFVQAHMVSQILSFAKGERSLLKVWLPGIEFFWIGCWSLAGAGLAYYLRFSWRMIGIVGGATFLVLYVTCLCLLTWGSLWVPLVPSAMSLFFTGGIVLYIVYRPYRKISDPMTKS